MDIKSLENNEFFQLMSESMEEIAAFIKENKVDAIYTSKLAEMEQLLAKLQAGLHLEAHVDSLAAAQKAFDKIYKERLTELKARLQSRIRQSASSCKKSMIF